MEHPDHFWFVWNKDRQLPRHMHVTEKSAIDEAERLARNSRGETFFVLESVCARKVDDMHRIDLRGQSNDVPF